MLQSLFPVARMTAPVGTLYSVERNSHCWEIFTNDDDPESNCRSFSLFAETTCPGQVAVALEVDAEDEEVGAIVAEAYVVYSEKLRVLFLPHQFRTLTSSAPR